MSSLRPITPEDVWRVARVGKPTPLADGHRAVLPVTTFDVEVNRGRTRLHLVSRDGTHRRLTSGEAESTAPAIAGDGRRVAFLRRTDEDDPTQLWMIPLDGGEAIEIANLPLGVSAPRWLPDGSGILVWSPLYREHLDVESTRVEHEAREERKVSAKVTEDRVYRYWDRWLTEGLVHHLFLVEPATGEVRDLMPNWTGLAGLDDWPDAYDVAPDGSEVAFHAGTVDPPYDELGFGIYTVSIEGGDPTLLDTVDAPDQERPRYSPDGSSIVFGARFEWPGFYADRFRLARYDRETGDTELLAEDWDRSPSAWEWAEDGHLVFHAEDSARSHLYRLAPGDSEPVRIAGGGWLDAPRPAGDAIWCRTQSLTRPAEVGLVADGEVTVVTRFNEDLLAGLQLGDVEEAWFSGAEGDDVQMWLVYPPGFDSSEQWPLVHNIHGGPHGVTGDLWHHRWNMQVFAAAGYLVAGVNFHGSSSWGNEYARSIQAEWGGKPSSDVLAATDHLVGLGFVDPDRVAVAGGSYGGYLVSWLTGSTNRFAAAVCHAGVTNLLGQYATDITHGRSQVFGGEPWDALEAIRAWSPTDHTASMSTPTLVIHGERDYRVVVTQGLELYGLLKAKGVEARLVYYPDEGHWILKPQNSLHWYGEVMGWLERYLGRPIPVPEQARQAD